MNPSSNIQYKIHFAKYKSGNQYIDNAVVLDVTDDDDNGIPSFREDVSAAGYGDDPFFLIRVQAKDEHNATTEQSFLVNLLNVTEDFDQDGIENHADNDDDGDGFDDNLNLPWVNPQSTPLKLGLVAHYPFDGNASDISDNALHGTTTSVEWAEPLSGWGGQSLSFPVPATEKS